ncbi:MAG: ADP-glyceromanno-heptose 6-epimerase [Edaphocola sp.]
MVKSNVIAITGAAGFIGSCLTAYLNELGYEQLILVDDFSDAEKVNNLRHKKFLHKVHREQFFDWLDMHPGSVQYIFHLGARTDTTDTDFGIFKKLNLQYSKDLWQYCAEHNVPLLYASTAASYGNGEYGYTDDETLVPELKPLNAYGVSKNEFDIWALEQKHAPPFWCGLKFFNVYGPNEYHKGRMASVIFHAYKQINEKGLVKLFRSHKPDFKDGEQLRDFVYVKDVVDVCAWMMQHQPRNGIYNLGTGRARSFKDLVQALFRSLAIKPCIEFIDTPEDIREKYQYFTQADMRKLRAAGYQKEFSSLEHGVADYALHYLEQEKYY